MMASSFGGGGTGGIPPVPVSPYPGATLIGTTTIPTSTITCTTTTTTPQQQQQQQQHPYIFENDYTLVKRLQSGSFGTVHITYHNYQQQQQLQQQQHQQPQEYAVKIIDRTKLKRQSDDDAVYREVNVLQELTTLAKNSNSDSNSSNSTNSFHHIIQLIDFYVTSTTFYIVQNYAKGGDVLSRLSKRITYTEKDGRDISLILLKVLSDLHSRKICHRDLKPENLLLSSEMDDTSLVVADFGFATHIPTTNTTRGTSGYLMTRCGTPAFVAPEIVIGQPYQEGVDMWSAGCIIYMLLCGRPPFTDPSLRGLYRKIRAADYTFYDAWGWKSVSIPAKRLISQCLTVDPTFRISAIQALTNSSWLQLDENNLSCRDLSMSLGEFQKFNAKRKLKSAVKAVLFSVQYATAFRYDDKNDFDQNAIQWDEQHNTQIPATNPTTSPNDDDEEEEDTPTKKNKKNDNINKTKKRRFSLYTINPLPFDQVYDIGRKLHSGSYAVVHTCRNRFNGKERAVKIIPRHSGGGTIPSTVASTDESVLHEVAIMNQLVDHPNYFVQVKDFFESDSYYYIVMEHMVGGDLFDRIVSQTHYTEKDARDLARILLEAVRYLHEEHGIAHRDLKPQNLLLQSKDCNATIKIADFGFSRKVHTPKSLTSRCGTPSYVAPEILKQIPHDTACDMWSVGVILYVLLCGYTPFMEDNQERMFDRIKSGDVKFEPPQDWNHVSEEGKDLIRHLMVVEPDKRYTAREALESPWMMQDDESLQSHDLSDSALATMKEKRPKLQHLARAFMGLGGLGRIAGGMTPNDTPQTSHTNVIMDLDDTIVGGSSTMSHELL